MKPIVLIPNPALSAVSRKVTKFDRKLQQLVNDMKSALLAAKNPKGVGLAAPQIGENWQIFVTKPTSKDPIRVFINPEIVSKSKSMDNLKKQGKLEGCLSVPNIWGEVNRASSLTLNYHDENGQIHTEEFGGFIATIIQHEMDHLQGTLFTYRVLEQKGKLYQTTKDKSGKEVLEEISL